MRVVLGTDFYAPLIGGAELQTRRLAETLASRGHDVAVATIWHPGMARREVLDGVGVERLTGPSLAFPAALADPRQRRYHPPLPDPIVALGMRRLIERHRADVVHAWGWIAYSARLATAGRRVPLILSARDFGYACPVRTLQRHGAVCSGPGVDKCLRNAAAKYGVPRAAVAVAGVLGLRRWLLSGVAAIHAPSRFVAAIEQRDLVRSDVPPIEVIPDMIAPMDPAAARDAPALGRLPAEPFILFVGALQPHKGIQQVLAAHARLRDAPPLVVVGTTWPDTPASWPARVVVLEDVANEIVRAIWTRALFGVAPSLVPETFGGVVTEGMISARPVIASALGGPLDTIEDGLTGLLVPPGDVTALAVSMQTLIDDASLRERMGAEARRRVEERFLATVVIPRFEALYARVAEAA